MVHFITTKDGAEAQPIEQSTGFDRPGRKVGFDPNPNETDKHLEWIIEAAQTSSRKLVSCFCNS